VSYFLDFLPGLTVFGMGIAILVAPLTSALMSSVPAHNSGVASAINNAISRVGPQLAGALIFVAITSSFYAGLQSRVPQVDSGSSELRRQVAPLNRPADDMPTAVVAAAQDASADAFHLAVLVSAGLLLAGATINAVGIRNPSAASATREPSEAPAVA
jgi:hypothetical protein